MKKLSLKKRSQNHSSPVQTQSLSCNRDVGNQSVIDPTKVVVQTIDTNPYAALADDSSSASAHLSSHQTSSSPGDLKQAADYPVLQDVYGPQQVSSVPLDRLKSRTQSIIPSMKAKALLPSTSTYAQVASGLLLLRSGSVADTCPSRDVSRTSSVARSFVHGQQSS